MYLALKVELRDATRVVIRPIESDERALCGRRPWTCSACTACCGHEHPEVAATVRAAAQTVRARGKLARRIIGNVADLVAERATCNVLIVRPREPG